MNRMLYASVILAAALAVCFPLAAADTTSNVQLLQIVALDVSSSMDSAERLGAAVAEIKSRVTQIPPSPTTPWILITFAADVKVVRRFAAGKGELCAFLDAVSAQGGTSIAAALKQVVDTIAASSEAPKVRVFLYTDGEDKNEDAIRAEEQRLEAIVGKRAEDGLTQTLVCRRWGDASAKMVARLSKIKGLQIVDAPQGRVVKQVIQPELAATDCRWVGAGLEIGLSAKVLANEVSAPSAVRVLCTTAGATGETALKLLPDGNTKTFQVGLTPPPGTVPKKVTLDFAFELPFKAGADASTPFVAALSQTQVSLAVDVPPPGSPTTISPSIVSVGKATWANVVDAVAAFDAELSIRVDGPFVSDEPILLVTPPEVTDFDFSPKSIRPGENSIQLEIHARVHPAPLHTKLAFELRPPEQDLVQVEVTNSIDLSILGPKPARLVLQAGGELLSTIEISSPGALSVTPIVLGAQRSAVPSDAAVLFAVDESLMLDMVGAKTPMFQPATIFSRDGGTESQSFFFDTITEGKVELRPVPTSMAIVGSKYVTTKTRTAPFKKVLFTTALSVAVICLLFFPFRFFCRIQSASLDSHAEKVQST